VTRRQRAGAGQAIFFTALTGGIAAFLTAAAYDAAAQAPAGGDAAQHAQASGPSIAFDIPAQPLAQALTQFARQSGLQVAVDAAAVSGKTTNGVSGTLSADGALQQILAGTGVTYRYTSPTSVTVVATGPSSGGIVLDPVQVQANVAPPQAEIGALPPPFAGGEVARGGRVGALGNRDYMNTPFSTTSYTHEYIRDNQALTLNEAVADDPTIRALYSQGSYDDSLFIRGFYLGPNDLAFNGLYGINPQNSVNLLGIERIEVFRGPSALLSGMAPNGAIGGTINLVPKRATDAPITQATARYASAGQFGGQFDFGRRFGQDKEFGVRFNGGYSGGNTPVDGQSDSLLAFTAGLDYRGIDTRIDADLGYQNRNIVAPQGGTAVAAGLLVPPAPNGTLNHYQPWGFYATNDTYGDVRFEHDLLHNLTAYGKFGVARSNGSFLLDFPTITSTLGTTTSDTLRWLNYFETLSAEAGFRGRFETGSLKHEAVLTGTWLSISTGASVSALPVAVTSNIYSPINQPAPDLAGLSANIPLTSRTVLSGIGLIDAISAWQDRVQLIGGVRIQSVQVSNWDPTTGQPTPGYDQSAVTPSVSLVVRPWKELSFYGNFIQALERGPTASGGTLNAGQTFAPFVSTQFEVGAKLDLGNFGATLSAFQITRPSAFTDPATNMLVVDGQQRNQGIEFTMFGEPVKGLRPIGGFTVLDPVLTSTLNGTNNGNYAPGVPTFQANLGLEWDVPHAKGLTVGGRIIYTGQAYIDPANDLAVPAWTRFDVSAKYVFERSDGKPIALRGQILNVGNNNYWIATPGYLTQGQARTFMLSLSADF
jgi:iron complex outermembrane receptor protein